MKLTTSPFSATTSALGGLAKCLAIAAPVFVISLVPSTAQETSQSHLNAAKSAISATGTSAPLDNILPIMAEQAKSQLISGRPDIAATISDVVDDATIALAPRRGDLENEVAAIYAKIFTEVELTEISDFYRSDAGKKLLAEAPIMERQIKQASQTWGSGVRRDLSQAIGEKLREFDKKTAEKPAE
ncbi:MAG: DUF2059 domain-containing protein [Rhizobiaceae bacterium]|nr:DUF2059 domain-containing protein [Rhizobiaceae bacterium]